MTSSSDALSRAALLLAQGDYAHAVELSLRLNDQAQRNGDLTTQGLACCLLAQAAVIESQFAQALTHLESDGLL